MASFARFIIAKFDARRAVGDTMDKIASLHDLLKAFVHREKEGHTHGDAAIIRLFCHGNNLREL